MNTVAATTAADAATVAASYLAAWNEADAGRRAERVAAAFSVDAHYLDPMMEGRGHDGIGALIDAVQQRFAGHHFALHGTPEGHHDVVRFSWALAADGAAPVARGTDVAELDADGRLRRVAGFIDYLAGA